MNTLIASVLFAGIISSNPIKICHDVCGQRVGCLTDAVALEVPTERPKFCDETMLPPPAAKLVYKDLVPTICVQGLLYFHRTLTPVFKVHTGNGNQSMVGVECE
jgi:hypothetical protein